MDKNNRIKMNKWILYGVHAPKSSNENCSICHSELYTKCHDCFDKSNNYLNIECPVSIGKCNHAFHHHCIYKWICEASGSAMCPICTIPWDCKVKNCNKSKWRRLSRHN